MGKRHRRRGPDAIRRELARRRKIRRVALALVALALAVVGVVWVVNLGREGGGDVQRRAAGPPVLLYADFLDDGALHRLDITSGDDEVIGKLDTDDADVVPSMSSSWVAAVRNEEEEGGRLPRLSLISLEGDVDPIELGVAQDPVWHPDGTRIAFHIPLQRDRCHREGCSGRQRVVVYDVESNQRDILVQDAEVNMEFWAGDMLLGYLEQFESDVLVVRPDGDTSRFSISPVDVMDPSPDGRWMPVKERGDERFAELRDDGMPSGENVAIDVPAGIRIEPLVDVWSPDGTRFAVVVSTRDGDRVAWTSPDDPQLRVLPDSTGFAGRLFWGNDSDSLLFTRHGDGELEALYCSLDTDECEQVLTWTSGILPLRLE